ncbi:MAG: LicD family protein [Bacteroidales bacterium]|nr:LicD family protein [Bacteroidales bacterium]MBQ8644880.1 LicD family protein [Bacteroidales bacterium]
MYTYNDIKKVQERLLDMANVIKSILESHNIPYFITYGTLLGAIRHGGFIPWDDDFDFHLFEDSYDLAIETLRKYLPENMFLEDEKSEPLYFHGWAHVKDLRSSTKCDLFPQDNSYTHKGISIDLYKIYKVKESFEKEFLIKEHIAYLNRRKEKELIDINLYNNRIEKLYQELNEHGNHHNCPEPDCDIYVCPGIYNDFFYLHELQPLKKYKFEDTYFYGPNCSEVFLTRCYGRYMSYPSRDNRHPHYSEVIFLD